MTTMPTPDLADLAAGALVARLEEVADLARDVYVPLRRMTR